MARNLAVQHGVDAVAGVQHQILPGQVIVRLKSMNMMGTKLRTIRVLLFWWARTLSMITWGKSGVVRATS